MDTWRCSQAGQPSAAFRIKSLATVGFIVSRKTMLTRRRTAPVNLLRRCKVGGECHSGEVAATNGTHMSTKNHSHCEEDHGHCCNHHAAENGHHHNHHAGEHGLRHDHHAAEHGHHHNHHAGEHEHSHNSLGCCSSSAPDSQLSRAVNWILTEIGVMNVVHCFEHSVLALAVSTTALILSGGLGYSCCGASTGMQASVPIRNLALGIVFVLSGLPMFVGGALRLAKGAIDAHVLMVCAVFGSVFLGLPSEGALLLVLYQLAHNLEDRFTNKTVASLKSLFDGIPETAVLVEMLPSGTPDLSATTPIAVESVPIGSHILIRPGEQVPLDGEVVYGYASITLDHISGESLPVNVTNQDRVAAGSRNNDGVLVLSTTHTSHDSTPARITRMAIDAQNQKPEVQRWIDTITASWSKGVILAAGLVLLGCLTRGIPFAGKHGAFYRSMGVITAGAPCGLLLAPLAYACALANASRRKILIKGAAVLDLLRRCTSIGLDKTGTLTQGSLTCSAIYSPRFNLIPADKYVQNDSFREVLSHAVSLSQLVSHPVALAVTEMGKKLGTSGHNNIEDFKSFPGEGVSGSVASPNREPSFLCFGSLDFVTKFLPEHLHNRIQETVSRADNEKSVAIFLEQSGQSNDWAVFFFEDEIRNNSADAVAALKTGSWKTGEPISSLEKSVVMLTGDAKSVAHKMASTLSISKVHAELKPEQKLDYILRNSPGGLGEHNRFAMVGDGLNDAPALSAADVGIAIASTANGASASAANLVILNGQGVGSLPFLFNLADQTHQVVVQNLALVFTSMVVTIIPTVAGAFPLWLAVLIHEGTTILTAINSLRLLMARPISSTDLALSKLTLESAQTPKDERVTVSVH